MMKKLLALSALLLGFFLVPTSQANVIYDWEGDCASGCVGTATATLELADTYVPGTFLVDSDFVSFTYASSSGTFSSPADVGFCCFDVAGTSILPAVSGPASDLIVDFAGGGTIFCAPDASGGAACFSTVAWNMVFAPLNIDDRGRDAGTWTLNVPEPATLALVTVGIAGAVGWRRRRRCPGR